MAAAEILTATEVSSDDDDMCVSDNPQEGPNGNIAIEIVDSKVNQVGQYLYKVCWRKYAWKEKADLSEYLLTDYWKKKECTECDPGIPPPPMETHNKVGHSDVDIIILRKVEEAEMRDLQDYAIDNFGEKHTDNALDDDMMMKIVKDEISIPVMVEQCNGGSLQWVARNNAYTSLNNSSLENTSLYPMVCSMCDDLCSSEWHYKKHWSEKHPNQRPTYKCLHCNKIFQSRHRLKEHAVCHSGERPYKCDLCDKTYIYLKNLTCHKKKSHPNISCSICDETFPNMEEFLEHTTVEHDENMYQCSRCKVFFKVQSEYQQHIAGCVSAYLCEVCPKSFANRSDCKMHERIHNGTNPHYCEQCDKYFLKKSKLMKHVEGHDKKAQLHRHSDDIKQYIHADDVRLVCETCGKRFKWEHHLRTHKILHEREAENGGELLKYVCKTCYVSFERLMHLKKHLQESPSCFSVDCTICGQKFQSKKRLGTHAKIHTNREAHKCGTCERSFGHKTDLIKHERIHSVDKQFHCDLCDQRFLERWLLRAHMEWHTTGRHPFQCPICDKILGKKSKLQAHVRCVHNKERDHVCDVCGKEYTSKTDLLKHLKVHEHENESGDLKCMICQADGFTATTLEEHQLVHMRVQMHAGEVLDFENVNQNRDFFWKEDGSDVDEHADSETQEADILISPRSPSDHLVHVDDADHLHHELSAKKATDHISDVNFPLTLTIPASSSESNTVVGETHNAISTMAVETTAPVDETITAFAMNPKEDLHDHTMTIVHPQQGEESNIQILTTPSPNEDNTTIQIVSGTLPAQIDEADLQIVTTIHLETENSTPISNELLQHTVQQLLMAAQESQQ